MINKNIALTPKHSFKTKPCNHDKTFLYQQNYLNNKHAVTHTRSLYSLSEKYHNGETLPRYPRKFQIRHVDNESEPFFTTSHLEHWQR